MLRWAEEQPQELRLEKIGESYGRYRLHVPELERGMMRSLESYGQLAPIVVVRQEGHWELIDGFKRLGAARKLPAMDRLLARQIEADEHSAKAAIYGLNRAGRVRWKKPGSCMHWSAKMDSRKSKSTRCWGGIRVGSAVGWP